MIFFFIFWYYIMAYIRKYTKGGKPKNTKAKATKGTKKATTQKRAYNFKNSRMYKNYTKPYRFPGAGATIGSGIGNMIAPGIGGVIGGGVGQMAHALTKVITGFGDYKIHENALLFNRDAVPEFASTSDRCTVITHSEFIRDVRGSTTFAIDSYDINASNNNLFPWLSQVARNYEQVIWQGLVFQFKTTSGTAISSTNTALGTVVMATQYDTLSESFSNKQQMENYEFSQSGVPCASLMHAIECDPNLTANHGLFYTDVASNSNRNADPRLYNIGRFNIATTGMQAAATIGELWVTYKVSLLKPRQIGNNNQADQWTLDYATLSESASRPFGLYPVLTSSSTSSMYNIAKQYNPYPSDQSFSSLGVNPWQNYAVANPSLFINPSFVGQIAVIYQIRNTTGTAVMNEPQFVCTGNIVEISDPNTAIGLARYDINGCIGGMHIVCLFQCQGGYNNSGVSPTITWFGGLYPGTGDTCAQGAVSVLALSNNLRNPSLPA